jgi:hypothetical protein
VVLAIEWAYLARSFQGEHYFDGGYYSTDNADLAIGFDRVMILALKRPPEVPSMSVVSIDET